MSSPCMCGSMLGGSAVLAKVRVPPGLDCALAWRAAPASARASAAAPPARKRRRSISARRPRGERYWSIKGGPPCEASALQRELLERVATRGHATAALGERPGDLGHVDVAARVHCDAVRGREAARSGSLGRAPAGQQPPVLVEYADPPVQRVADGAALTRR